MADWKAPAPDAADPVGAQEEAAQRADIMAGLRLIAAGHQRGDGRSTREAEQDEPEPEAAAMVSDLCRSPWRRPRRL